MQAATLVILFIIIYFLLWISIVKNMAIDPVVQPEEYIHLINEIRASGFYVLDWTYGVKPVRSEVIEWEFSTEKRYFNEKGIVIKREFSFEPLHPYVWNPTLADIAQYHANRHILGHDDFHERGEPLRNGEWGGWGEIVAVHFDAENSLKSFMASDKGHRAAILNPNWYHAGAGISVGEVKHTEIGDQNIIFWVVWFGRKYTDPAKQEDTVDYKVFLPIINGG